MSPLNLALWGLGVVLVVVGYTRAKGPWSRCQTLKDQDANVARYEAWRGSLRNDAGGRTGASVAMDILRRQARAAGAIALIGIALIVLGFVLR